MLDGKKIFVVMPSNKASKPFPATYEIPTDIPDETILVDDASRNGDKRLQDFTG